MHIKHTLSLSLLLIGSGKAQLKEPPPYSQSFVDCSLTSGVCFVIDGNMHVTHVKKGNNVPGDPRYCSSVTQQGGSGRLDRPT